MNLPGFRDLEPTKKRVMVKKARLHHVSQATAFLYATNPIESFWIRSKRRSRYAMVKDGGPIGERTFMEVYGTSRCIYQLSKNMKRMREKKVCQTSLTL